MVFLFVLKAFGFAHGLPLQTHREVVDFLVSIYENYDDHDVVVEERKLNLYIKYNSYYSNSCVEGCPNCVAWVSNLTDYLDVGMG